MKCDCSRVNMSTKSSNSSQVSSVALAPLHISQLAELYAAQTIAMHATRTTSAAERQVRRFRARAVPVSPSTRRPF